eukprot:2345471-Pleurochrysis_carterae.AAC.5
MNDLCPPRGDNLSSSCPRSRIRHRNGSASTTGSCERDEYCTLDKTKLRRRGRVCSLHIACAMAGGQGGHKKLLRPKRSPAKATPSPARLSNGAKSETPAAARPNAMPSTPASIEMEETQGSESEGEADVPSSKPLALNAAATKKLKGAIDKKAKSSTSTVQKRKQAGAVLYLGHIPHGFYEEQMRGFFSQFGTVTRLRLARNSKVCYANARTSFAQLEDLRPKACMFDLPGDGWCSMHTDWQVSTLCLHRVRARRRCSYRGEVHEWLPSLQQGSRVPPRKAGERPREHVQTLRGSERETEELFHRERAEEIQQGALLAHAARQRFTPPFDVTVPTFPFFCE